jgi:hypothetical protein
MVGVEVGTRVGVGRLVGRAAGVGVNGASVAPVTGTGAVSAVTGQEVPAGVSVGRTSTVAVGVGEGAAGLVQAVTNVSSATIARAAGKANGRMFLALTAYLATRAVA